MSVKYSINTVKSDCFEMDYVKFGNGSRFFVIIPGISLKSITLSAQGIADAYGCFADDYTVFVFDRRKNAPSGYLLAQMAEDTAQAMRILSVTDADIFGASQGGMIAQYLAARHHDLVRKLVLGSTMPCSNETSDRVFKNWSKLAKAHDVRALNRDCFEKMFSQQFLDANRDVLTAIENDGTAEECDRFAVFTDSMFNYSVYDELENISCPVLVLGAENDNVLSGAASVKIADKLGCECYMYKGAAHAVYDEAADYKQRIIEFFNK